VPAELIRDQLAQDARIIHAFNQFDPHAANILARIELPNTNWSFLAFPMGPVFCNLSRLLWYIFM